MENNYKVTGTITFQVHFLVETDGDYNAAMRQAGDRCKDFGVAATNSLFESCTGTTYLINSFSRYFKPDDGSKLIR